MLLKCDEAKPSCTRCVLCLENCKYPLAPQPVENSARDGLDVPSPSVAHLSTSGSPSSASDQILSSAASPYRDLSNSGADQRHDASIVLGRLSDTDLYHHYLQHTCRTLSFGKIDQIALQIRMPTLALQSETVFHSLLAVSAASIAWDMISKEPPPDTDTVNQVLLTGYRHYNIASERMRESISKPSTFKPEPLIASAILLVPFATSSQQINHWLSSRRVAQESHKLLSSTPRDVIIIMRGIRTMLQTIEYSKLNFHVSSPPETTSEIGDFSISPALSPGSTTIAPSRTHVMSAIIASTIPRAFSKLQYRLESSRSHGNQIPENSLSACFDAFNIIEQLRISAFRGTSPLASPPTLATELFSEPITNSHEHPATSSPQIASWLRSFADRYVVTAGTAPQSTEPLTHFFLSFLVKAPQGYLDLVLPLLDQRLERPADASLGHSPVELTQVQVLALDIYAHWSVLMLLVEEESWWIGTLPVVTLAGMVNKYGDRFVNKWWPENEIEKGQWWPAGMLNILRNVKQYQ